MEGTRTTNFSLLHSGGRNGWRMEDEGTNQSDVAGPKRGVCLDGMSHWQSN